MHKTVASCWKFENVILEGILSSTEESFESAGHKCKFPKMQKNQNHTALLFILNVEDLLLYRQKLDEYLYKEREREKKYRLIKFWKSLSSLTIVNDNLRRKNNSYIKFLLFSTQLIPIACKGSRLIVCWLLLKEGGKRL